MRRIVVMSVVVLAVLACGVVVALAASGGKSTPISKKQAVAFAQAVNLRTGDLPPSMWTTIGKEEPPVTGEAPPTLCLVTSAVPMGRTGKGVISVASPLIVLQSAPHVQNETVWSRVFVMPSVGAARADLNAERKCLARLLRRVGGVGISPLTATLPRTQVAERRLLVPALLEGRGVARYLDRLLFQVGRAEIELKVNAVAAPMPATTEQQLLSLLYSRAEAHKL